MIAWVEERVTQIRRALPVTGFPRRADLWRLVAWLGENVRVEQADVCAGFCAPRRAGGYAIVLPAGIDAGLLDAQLAEELGHALLPLGLAELLRQQGTGSRLARRWNRMDEAHAEEFVRVWWMPAELALECDTVEDLSEQAQVTHALAAARIEALRSGWHVPAEAPFWAARWYYCVECWETADRQAALVTGGAERFVVGLPRDAPSLAAALERDLQALTTDEFRVKWAWRGEAHGAALAGAES